MGASTVVSAFDGALVFLGGSIFFVHRARTLTLGALDISFTSREREVKEAKDTN